MSLMPGRCDGRPDASSAPRARSARGRLSTQRRGIPIVRPTVPARPRCSTSSAVHTANHRTGAPRDRVWFQVDARIGWHERPASRTQRLRLFRDLTVEDNHRGVDHGHVDLARALRPHRRHRPPRPGLARRAHGCWRVRSGRLNRVTARHAPYGIQRRVGWRAQQAQPRLLPLDEPAAGLAARRSASSARSYGQSDRRRHRGDHRTQHEPGHVTVRPGAVLAAELSSPRARGRGRPRWRWSNVPRRSAMSRDVPHCRHRGTMTPPPTSSWAPVRSLRRLRRPRHQLPRCPPGRPIGVIGATAPGKTSTLRALLGLVRIRITVQRHHLRVEVP